MWKSLGRCKLLLFPRLHTSTRAYSARAAHLPPSQVSSIAQLKQLKSGDAVDSVEVCGWVRSVRKASAVRFVDISDGSSMRPLQAVVEKSKASDIRVGAAIRLEGTWHNNPSSGEASDQSPVGELQVRSVEILGPSDPKTNPIQNKYQTAESLRLVPHLRMRTSLNSTLLRLRSDAIFHVTQFFHSKKFQQTHPPIITSSDCEGAGEAFSVKSGKEEFFRDPKYLTVSSQLHLEALAQGLGDVWTLSPTFRAEQSDTSRHLGEFYMLEAEMSFVKDMDQVMDLVQEMLASLVTNLREQYSAREWFENRLDAREPAEKLAFQDLDSLDILRRRWTGMATSTQWPRITYTEAIERLKTVADRFEHKPEWGAGLQSEHERYLANEIGYDPSRDAYVPIFVTQYPRELKAFYMPQSLQPPAQGPTVDCFDLLVPQLGELAGGSLREHRLAELVDNMRHHGLEVPEKGTTQSNDMNWYLDLRRWGCAPHGGFGLGFDRLLSYLTGVQSLSLATPFSRHPLSLGNNLGKAPILPSDDTQLGEETSVAPPDRHLGTVTQVSPSCAEKA